MNQIDLLNPDLADDIYDFCYLPEFYQDFCDKRELGLSMIEFIDFYHATDFENFIEKKYA